MLSFLALIKRSSLLVLSLAATAGSATAGINVTHATVYQSHSPVTFDPPPTTATLFDASSPGSNFDTYDGHSGLTSTLTDAGGTLNARTYGLHSLVANGYDIWGTSGTVNFDVTSGTLSISTDRGALTGGSLTLKNLDTKQFWTISALGFGGYTSTTSGDLSTTAAPAGHYQFDFNVASTWAAGHSNALGYMSATIVVTPEPVSLLAAAGGAALILRRRR